MRKLVYAFYDQNFSFRQLTDKYPELAGDVTDCLSGDVNKDYSRLWAAVGELAPGARIGVMPRANATIPVLRAARSGS